MTAPSRESQLPCGHPRTLGVQYQGTIYDYDGVSEWHCQTCGKRFGRWSGRELREGEYEPRYGAQS